MIVLNDNFKKKLKDYTEGKLSEEEKKEIEIDFEKLEDYQEFLEQQQNTGNEKKSEDALFNNKKQVRRMKISKWKARMQNALTVIGILIIVTFVTGILTELFYSSGKPNRIEIYRDVVKSTIAITKPNMKAASLDTQSGPYFTANMKGQLQKRVGKDNLRVGEIDMKFLLGKGGFQGIKSLLNENQNLPFIYPKSKINYVMDRDWKKLEKLPEGTVAEAYISFNRFYETDEILQKFKDKQVDPLWFAVDTGFEDKRSADEGYIIDPVGFPYWTMWHSDDMILKSRTDNKGILFSKIVSETKSSPDIEDYGSGKLRNENFIKTLELLKKYESIASNVASPTRLDITRRLDYVNANGVKIYGMVITGPSKEILKLKTEEWVKGINIGEVRLWNWEP